MSDIIQVFIFVNRLEHFQFIKIISYEIKQFSFPPLKKAKLEILNFKHKNYFLVGRTTLTLVRLKCFCKQVLNCFHNLPVYDLYL